MQAVPDKRHGLHCICGGMGIENTMRLLLHVYNLKFYNKYLL